MGVLHRVESSSISIPIMIRSDCGSTRQHGSVADVEMADV